MILVAKSVRLYALLFLVVVFSVTCKISSRDANVEKDSVEQFDRRYESDVLKKRVDSITQIQDLPYTPEFSGDPLFWRIVCDGLGAMPFLIEKLDDSTSAHVFVPVYGGEYMVGDVAFSIISCIIPEIPTSEFIPKEFQNNSFGSFFSLFGICKS